MNLWRALKTIRLRFGTSSCRGAVIRLKRMNHFTLWPLPVRKERRVKTKHKSWCQDTVTRTSSSLDWRRWTRTTSATLLPTMAKSFKLFHFQPCKTSTSPPDANTVTWEFGAQTNIQIESSKSTTSTTLSTPRSRKKSKLIKRRRKQMGRRKKMKNKKRSMMKMATWL